VRFDFAAQKFAVLINDNLIADNLPFYSAQSVFGTGFLKTFGSATANDIAFFDDYSVVSSSAAGFPGDANGDLVVDFADLGILLNHYNQPGTFPDGDFDATGIVDFADLGILLNNYNVHAPTASETLPVPEPASLVMALGSGLALAFLARGRRYAA
jgi:hypothetical protein